MSQRTKLNALSGANQLRGHGGLLLLSDFIVTARLLHSWAGVVNSKEYSSVSMRSDFSDLFESEEVPGQRMETGLGG
jgi:hypothetical protein